MTLIDISPTLSAASPVFPGDTPFRAARTWALGGACPVNVSKFETTTHIDAHAAAPLHYDAAGAAIDAVALEPYVGPCVVLDLAGGAGPVTAQEIEAALAAAPFAPRALLRTTTRAAVDRWETEYRAVDAGAVRALAAKGARLIGVDTPSLDPETSKTMDAHRAVFEADMRILEGLVLDHVAPGLYELIALPLKLAGLDAAPVRAVLRRPA